jgi:RNA polymerase sigma-70 factor (ECF subfamily)
MSLWSRGQVCEVFTRDMTLSDVQRLRSEAGEADVAFHMDEDTFRAFYDRTARALWVYLSRMTGDRQLADDLLQETYYRFVRAAASHESDAHRRHYLFRIATNLVRDGRRRRRPPHLSLTDEAPRVPASEDGDVASRFERRADLSRALARLRPRDRALLWLAYGQGSSHREIGETLGVKTASVKPLLFRARRKLAALLRGGPSRPSGPGCRSDR